MTSVFSSKGVGSSEGVVNRAVSFGDATKEFIGGSNQSCLLDCSMERGLKCIPYPHTGGSEHETNETKRIVNG